jgi:hypothetical protein
MTESAAATLRAYLDERTFSSTGGNRSIRSGAENRSANKSRVVEKPPADATSQQKANGGAKRVSRGRYRRLRALLDIESAPQDQAPYYRTLSHKDARELLALLDDLATTAPAKAHLASHLSLESLRYHLRREERGR